jgi:hypothetical protein
LPPRDETGSLPLALLLTLVVGALTAALLPVVLSQVSDTRLTVNRGHAMNAAQTGLEVAVAAIRAAYGPSGQGDRTLLPCGPITGTGGSETAATYRVELAYFDKDPSLSDAIEMTCPDAQDASKSMPRSVRLTATGTTAGGTQLRRALRGDYPLSVAPAATPTASATWGPQYDGDYIQPRGIIAWSADGTTSYCADPGFSQPPTNTVVRLQLCDVSDYPDNSYKQNWYYRQDLTLAPVGSIMAGKPMCLDAGAIPVVGAVVTMQPCGTPVPARQRWYHNNSYNYELATSTGPGVDDWALNGLCLNVETPETSGSRMVLGTGVNCHSGTYNARQTFATYPKLGPGQAGSRRLDCTADAGYPCVRTQLVNNAEPSRCVDKYDTFVATMECVQDPDPTKVRWNQQWRLPVAADGPTGTVGPLVVVDPAGAKFCLTASADVPVQQTCNPRNPAANQKFTIYRNTGVEFTMYRIIDSSGRCMTYPNGTDDGNNLLFHWNSRHNWKVHLDSCVDSANDPRITDRFSYASIVRRQKWDAPFLLPPAQSTTPAPGPTVALAPQAASTLPLLNLTEVPPGG